MKVKKAVFFWALVVLHPAYSADKSISSAETIEFLNDKMNKEWVFSEQGVVHYGHETTYSHTLSLKNKQLVIYEKYSSISLFLPSGKQDGKRDSRTEKMFVMVDKLDPSRTELRSEQDDKYGYSYFGVRLFCLNDNLCIKTFNRWGDKKTRKVSFIYIPINGSRESSQVHKALRHLIEINGGKTELF